MARRFPRTRTRLSATVQVAGTDTWIVCPTRDIGKEGCFLETAQALERGTKLSIAVMDHARGAALNVSGVVARRVPPDAAGVGAGIGVQLSDPGPEWTEMVSHYETGGQTDARTRRLRVLVVGEQTRQRGALALYVTSGWDIRFASDIVGATEALNGINLDAIIAEYDLTDERWQELFDAAQQIQPAARRVLRSRMRGRTPRPPQGLVQHMVALEDGLEALVDALSDVTT